VTRGLSPPLFNNALFLLLRGSCSNLSFLEDIPTLYHKANKYVMLSPGFVAFQSKHLLILSCFRLAMLEADHIASETLPNSVPSASPLGHSKTELDSSKGKAVWEYMIQTLDPVIETSLIGEDNPYYLVCLQGCYSQRCHPDYLKPKSHQKLSRGGAFDGLRIHTDEINEVIARLTPGTLTVAVVMDSMDWFDPGAEAAGVQIEKLNRALKLRGRVLLRSAALMPWYIATFESLGFQAKRVGARIGGACIDRFVSFYQFHWVNVWLTGEG